MIASELKVYRDTFELTKLILEVVKQFPKLAKYTIGQRAIDTCLNLLDLIQMINLSSYNVRKRLFSIIDKEWFQHIYFVGYKKALFKKIII